MTQLPEILNDCGADQVLGRHRAPIGEVCQKYGISEQTFYRWKKRFGRLTPSEIKELRPTALPGIDTVGLLPCSWSIFDALVRTKTSGSAS